MGKRVLDLTVVESVRLTEKHTLLKLNHTDALPTMFPGQFVEVLIQETPEVMLRRPISIHNFDADANELWLLVAAIGNGTRWLCSRKAGDKVNCLLPLGHGFTTDSASPSRPLLVGGGVGVAPLYYLGREFLAQGVRPTFLLGGRKAADILQIEAFRSIGDLYVTTEDGSLGEQGFVTDHSVLASAGFSSVYACGPTPMMKAVARYAVAHGLPCEVSLENMMACGLGACLCCVEKTVDGNVCVCKEGPVFNIDKLLWQR